MTWDETLQELQKIQKQFIPLHEKGERNYTQEDKDQVRSLRAQCVQIGQIRYKLLRKL